MSVPGYNVVVAMPGILPRAARSAPTPGARVRPERRPGRSAPPTAHVTAHKINLTPDQLAARDALARDNVHISFGQGQHGGWGFGMAVRTYRGDYAPIGQFGWDGGTGTSTYADPHNRLTGTLLTQVGMSTPDSARLIHDFWTTVYQAIDY